MWLWDALKGLFLLDGEVVDRDTIAGLLEKSTLFTQSSLMNIAEQLQSGTLSPYSAEAAMRNILKTEFIRQYLSGIGGRLQATFSDWGTVGAMLKKQYGFLTGLVASIRDMSPEKMAQRIGMYARSGEAAYDRARGKVALKVGYSYVRWDLDQEITDHCETCLARAELDFVETGDHGGFVDDDGTECWPGDGTSECFSNDHCNLTYMNADGDEYEL